MSRQDKIGAAVLGVLLFSGLFYFIYTTMKNPLPAEFGDETFAGENLGDENYTDDLGVDEETPLLSTGTVSGAGQQAPAAAPAARPADGNKAK